MKKMKQGWKMTSEELVKELRSDRERIPREFTNAAATLIESQVREIAELKSQNERLAVVLKQCIEELGELSGPPLSRRVKLMLEAS